jgi:TonB family protein
LKLSDNRNVNANRTSSGYELKSELARLSLPSANRDANLKLGWVNSICILFLLIGIVGARRGAIKIQPAPPLQEIIPVIVEPTTLPPQITTEKKEVRDENKIAQVVVAIPQSPNVSFSVPTIGALVVPANLASAPPLEPMRAAQQIGSLNNTGAGGERPSPPYPIIARQTGQQGTVVILLGGDAAGNVISVDVKESSGFPILDRATADFIKRHWRLPTGADNRIFQTSVTYQLQF